jgi:hypothetical protein
VVGFLFANRIDAIAATNAMAPVAQTNDDDLKCEAQLQTGGHIMATFADLGTTINDAARRLERGHWQNTAQEEEQGPGSLFQYTSDLQTAQIRTSAEITAGHFSRANLANVRMILNHPVTAISAAPASVNGGGSFGSFAVAETALCASHFDMLKIQHRGGGAVP